MVGGCVCWCEKQFAVAGFPKYGCYEYTQQRLVGLEVVWSMDCRPLVVESDSADALKAIARGICNNGQIV
ncbi:hypothetical protein V6N11_075183 [Hibiscus sabdariffa]|uniref:RNase H type-1 domain-containing protein n=1 Tax=Hibiscus sabdariffa TaxID=183260 RepID=A0ABR2R5Q7_9ROSI